MYNYRFSYISTYVYSYSGFFYIFSIIVKSNINIVNKFLRFKSIFFCFQINYSNQIDLFKQNDDLYTFLSNASFTLLTIVEFGRLYAGYYGNRLEKVFIVFCLVVVVV